MLNHHIVFFTSWKQIHQCVIIVYVARGGGGLFAVYRKLLEINQLVCYNTAFWHVWWLCYFRQLQCVSFLWSNAVSPETTSRYRLSCVTCIFSYIFAKTVFRQRNFNSEIFNERQWIKAEIIILEHHCNFLILSPFDDFRCHFNYRLLNGVFLDVCCSSKHTS